MECRQRNGRSPGFHLGPGEAGLAEGVTWLLNTAGRKASLSGCLLRDLTYSTPSALLVGVHRHAEPRRHQGKEAGPGRLLLRRRGGALIREVRRDNEPGGGAAGIFARRFRRPPLGPHRTG